MLRRWRRLRGWLRWRARWAIGVLVLLTISATLLVWARVTLGFTSDLLLNLGASMVIVALTYAVFEPLFEELRRSRVQEHPSFDHAEFSGHAAVATDIVAVMDTGNHMLEGASRRRFLTALGSALGNGAVVRILLLDPDSAAAAQRSEEVASLDVGRLIRDNLRHLHAFATACDPGVRQRFQVRTYDAAPSIQMFRWDDKALISFFPIGIRASSAPHLEVYLTSPLGEFVQSRFDDLWRHPSSRDLVDYLTVPVSVRHRGEVVRDCQVPFVRAGQACFVDGAPMIDQLADYGSSRLELATAHPFEVDGRSGMAFRLARVDGGTEPGRGQVLALFDDKYGPRQVDGPGRPRLAMRLVHLEKP